MKKLLLLVVWLLTMALYGCSEALNCTQCQCNTTDSIDIGTLPNGAHVYLDKNSVSIDKNTPAQINACVSGGNSNETFKLEFGSSQLQPNSLSSDSNGITVTPKTCDVNNSNNLCKISISSSPTTEAWTYYIPVIAANESNVPTTELSPITVLVSNPVSSNSKDITTFIINGVQATINDTQESIGSTINMTLPYGTSLSNLTANYITTGVSVSVNNKTQQSGSSTNNFTDPLVYEVTAEDGTTKDYTVTVNVAPSSAKEITQFSILGKDAEINQSTHNITLVLPDGTPLDDLIANFIITGKNVTVNGIKQTSTITYNDFTNPLSYVVYAADGTSQPYTVTVTTSGEDTGGGWKDVGEPGFSSGIADQVNMVIGSNGIPYVGYKLTEQNNNVMINSFQSPVWLPPSAATVDGSISFGMTIDSLTNIPYVIYQNYSIDLMAMIYTNNIWSGYPTPQKSNVGKGGDFTGHDTMAIDPITDQPCFASVSNGAVNITEYDANLQTWNIRKTIASAKLPVISFDQAGVLYVAYVDTNLHDIYIESANSSNVWSEPTLITQYDINQCTYNCLTIKVNPQNNQPALAYQLNGSVYFTSYDSSWSAPITVSSTAAQPDLAFNNIGTPYLAYIDNSSGSNSGAATVVAQSGGSWNSVGEIQFSRGKVNYLNLVINPATQRPYVAYKDEANAGRASAMYFAGNL
jgi:hypothetical protein